MEQQSIIIEVNTLRKVIRESVHEALGGYGFTTEDQHALQADMLHLRKSRTGSEDLAKVIKKSAIVIAVSGVCWALVEGIKQGFRH
jgi:hypothetical protein